MNKISDLTKPATAQHWGAVRQMLREYAASLAVDLCFQGFEQELAELPGDYSEPGGTLLTIHVDTQLAGCCAMRPLDSVDHHNACEMKRLYVRPAFRGLGLGHALAQGTLEAARVAGYASVLLDTLSDMDTARAMYRDLGFTEIPPYYYNPIPGSCYLKLDL